MGMPILSSIVRCRFASGVSSGHAQVPAAFELAGAAARQQNRQVVVVVIVAVAHAGSRT